MGILRKIHVPYVIRFRVRFFLNVSDAHFDIKDLRRVNSLALPYSIHEALFIMCFSAYFLLIKTSKYLVIFTIRFFLNTKKFVVNKKNCVWYDGVTRTDTSRLTDCRCKGRI